ncbi:PTS sugar transporter subunit IIB [Leuconostoc sp. JNUCC 76]
MNILVSCANGSGTSLMMMKSVEKSMKKLGIPISKINHTSLAEGKSTATQYDAVFTPLNFVNMFEDAAKKGVTVVGVKNVMSDKEITQRIIDETDFEEKYKK